MQHLMTTTTDIAVIVPKAKIVTDVSRAFDVGRAYGTATRAAVDFLAGLETVAQDVTDALMAGHMAATLFKGSRMAQDKLIVEAMRIRKLKTAGSKTGPKRTPEQETAYNAAKMFVSRELAASGHTTPNPKAPRKPANKPAPAPTNVVQGGNVIEKAVTPGFANGQELEAYLLLQATAMSATVRKNGKHARVQIANAVAEFAKAMKAATADH